MKLAADRLSLQLRNAGASVASALPGVPAASAAVAAIDSSNGLPGSGPATNRLLSLLINAVRVGVEAYAVAVRMLFARVAHSLTSFRTMSSCLNGQKRSRRDWDWFLSLSMRLRMKMAPSQRMIWRSKPVWLSRFLGFSFVLCVRRAGVSLAYVALSLFAEGHTLGLIPVV